MNKLKVVQWNINTIRNLFDFLAHQVKGDNTLMLSETKFGQSFPAGQFFIHEYSVSFRFDKDGNGGGILLYIREDIPSTLLSVNQNIEVFFVEINLRNKKKILLNYSESQERIDTNHLAELSKITDLSISY